MRYIVVYEHAEQNWATFVSDVPGCVAVGATRKETEKLIAEALQMHLEAMLDDKELLPQPGAWTGIVQVAVAAPTAT